MNMSDYIALSSLLISIIAIIFSILTNTKKYELTSSQRSEMLDWYQETVEILILIRLSIVEGTETNKTENLAKLSALIECGRFYFPNVDKGDSYGDQKPSAYKGYRDITLEFLVYSYEIFHMEDAKKYLKHLEQLQRLFTSRVFDVLSPQNYNKHVKKYTMIPMDKGISAIDYLKSDPANFKFFL